MGGFALGPFQLGRIAAADPVLLSLGLAGVFVRGLEEQVSTVLGHADQGSGLLLVLITAVNGVAEELLP